MVANSVSSALFIAMEILRKNEKDEAMEILSVCKKWADIGATTDQIYTIMAWFGKDQLPPNNADYDKNLEESLPRVYYDLCGKSDYQIELVNECIRCKRGYGLVSDMAKSSISDEDKFDLLPYVKDTRWSDDWIKAMKSNVGKIVSGIGHGYKPLEIFTPEHNPAVFSEVADLLFYSSRQNKIPTYWLSDTNWTEKGAHIVVMLYDQNPSIDWGKFIKPWTSTCALNELLDRQKEMTEETLNEVLKFWDNVTPKLDFVIETDGYNWSYPEVRKLYSEYKSEHMCDGDELALTIRRSGYSAEIESRSEYWHSKHVPYVEITDKGSGRRSGNTFMNAMRMMMG